MKKQLIELSQQQQQDTYHLQPPYSLDTYLNTKILPSNGSPQLQSNQNGNYLNGNYQPYEDPEDLQETNCFQDCWNGFLKVFNKFCCCNCFRSHVGLDRLKLKIVTTVIVSICVGIIFSGIVNYALALVLADNITKTTTSEIANVQIDYTRTIGMHLACVYQHMIQEQLDKALTVLARVQEVFSASFTPTGIATFTAANIVSNAYLSYQSGSTAGTCLTSEAQDQDKIMWFTTSGDLVTTTTYISNLMDTFAALRSIAQDTELKGIVITIFDGSQVSFPKRYDSSYSTLTSGTQTMTTSSDYVNTQNMYVNNNKRIYYSMKHANAVCSGTTTVMIRITMCISILCSDLGNPALCGGSSVFGGTICLYFLIKESNFLHSLKNRDISKIYISQMNAAQTGQAYTPLIAFDSITTNFISSFWSGEFNVASYTGSDDAINFHNNFDRFYSMFSSTEFLITSTYMKTDREFQIAIYTVNFDTDTSFSGTQLIFTTITEIPISDEIFKPMNEEIASSMNDLLIAGILLLMGLLFIVFFYIYFYSNHIIIPINKLKEEVEQIDRGNLYIKVQNNTQKHWQEIDSLFDHFEHLNTIIRASDDFYYQDLSEETLIKYSEAYNLFEKQGNRKGMGIVLNNIGNIHMKQERIENAMQSYLESFQIAERDLLELLLVDNIFAYYNVQPFNGWESAKRYDFSYNYLFYEKIKNRPENLLLSIANKPLIERTISNRAYALGTAYLQSSFRTTNSIIKQDYLTNAIDYLHLTEKLDFAHSKCSSRTIFTKLKLVQAFLEKAKYYYDIKVEDKYIKLYIESLRSQDSAVDQMARFEMMYKLFEQNFQNEIPPEILRQHCKFQEGCCYIEFNKFGKAIRLFTDNLREGIRYDPQVRKQCLNKIKWILEQQKLIDLAPDLLKMIKDTEMKKQKDIVFVLDFSQSMNCITKESYLVNVKIRQRDISNASNNGQLPRNSLKYGTNRIRENSKTNDSYLQLDNVRTTAHSNYNNNNSTNWSNQNNNNSNRIAKRTSQMVPNGVQDRKSLLDPKKTIEYNHKNAAISQFLRLFNDFVENEDRVAYVRFNENIDVVFELNEKSNNTQFLRSSIQNSYDLEPKGESAVRQAIYQAMKLFQKTVPKDHSQWIVLFSDGGDSCSTITDRQLLKYLNQAGVNLFIIGCGLDEYASKQFRQLCEKTKNGIFIETNSNQSEIDIAFQAITNKIYGNADTNYNVEEFL